MTCHSRFHRLQRVFWFFVFFLSIHSTGFSQSRVTVKHEGKDENLYYIDKRGAYVLIDGKKRKADLAENALEKADSFGAGFVESRVTLVETPKKSSKRVQAYDQKLFKYETELIADRDMDYCYGVLVYLVNGNPTTYFETIGKLRKGKVKKM